MLLPLEAMLPSLGRRKLFALVLIFHTIFSSIVHVECVTKNGRHGRGRKNDLHSALPPPPLNLRQVDSKRFGVTIAWDPVSSLEAVTEYIVYYRRKDETSSTNPEITDRNAVDHMTLNTTETRATITGLAAYTVYAIHVASKNNVGVGKKSRPLEIQTNEAKPGDAPRNIEARVVSDTSVFIQWRAPAKPNGEIKNYVVYYTNGPATSPFNSWTQKQTQEYSTSLTVENLQTGDFYRFRISAVNAVGAGDLSKEVIVKVRKDVPGQPLRVIVMQLGADRIRLSWEAPFSTRRQRLRYIIWMNSTKEMQSPRSIITDRGILYKNFDDLESDTFYTFNVSARGEDGVVGPAAAPVTIKTNPSVPQSAPVVTVESNDATSVNVIWEAPQQEDPSNMVRFTKYRIKWRPVDAAKGSEKSVVQSANDGLRYTIEHLIPATEYEVMLAAATFQGFGPDSEPHTIATHFVVPDPPSDVTAKPMNSTALIIRWRPPLENGNVDYYFVQIEDSDGKERRIPFETKAHSHCCEYVVHGLKPKETYKINVLTVNQKGDSSSNTLEIQTPGLAPPAPLRVNCRFTDLENAQNNVKLTWAMPTSETSAEPTSFLIRYGLEGEPEITTKSKVKQILLRKLKAGRKYTFSVVAVNKQGEGEPKQQECNVPEAAPSGPPIKFRVTYVPESDSLVFTWQAPDPDKRHGRISSYNVRIMDRDSSLLDEETV